MDGHVNPQNCVSGLAAISVAYGALAGLVVGAPWAQLTALV